MKIKYQYFRIGIKNKGAQSGAFFIMSMSKVNYQFKDGARYTIFILFENVLIIPSSGSKFENYLRLAN